MLDHCIPADSPISRGQRIQTHQASINRNLLFGLQERWRSYTHLSFTILGKDFILKWGALGLDGTGGRRASDCTSKHRFTIAQPIDATLLRWRGGVVREHVV